MRNLKIQSWILMACALPAAAQVATQANEHYQTHEGREAVARGLGSPGRDASQHPRRLVASMKLAPGMTVADIGTGVGYMLPYLSQAVGAQGKVIAEDIFDDFLAQARAKAGEAHLENVAFVKGAPTDPHLPAGAVDVILALDSYHHYDYPEKMLAGFHQALRDGGRLVIVEYYKRPNAMPGGDALQHIRLDQPGLVREVEAHHFKLLSTHDQIPNSQYMAIFEKN